MAEAAIGAGINIGEASFGALLDIKASVDTLGDLTRELLRQQEAYEEYGPVQLALRAAGVSAASGVLIMNLGGPSYGRLWEVRRLIIGGATWGATVAGRGDIVVAANTPNATNRSLPDIVDVAASLPSVAFYSSGQIVLRNPQQLYVVIVNPTATTQYAVGGGGFDVPDRPAYRVVGQ